MGRKEEHDMAGKLKPLNLAKEHGNISKINHQVNNDSYLGSFFCFIAFAPIRTTDCHSVNYYF